MTESKTKRGLDYIAGAFGNLDPDDDGSERHELIRSLAGGPPLPAIVIIAAIGLGFFGFTAYYLFVARMTVGWMSMLAGCFWLVSWIASDIRGYIAARYLYKHHHDSIRDHLIARGLVSRDEMPGSAPDRG